MNARLTPEQYMFQQLSTVEDFNRMFPGSPQISGGPRVYVGRQNEPNFPSVVFYASGGEVTDTNRASTMTAQDFRMEIRVVDDEKLVQGRNSPDTKSLVEVRNDAIAALKKGGRLARFYPPTTLFDPDVEANREIVEVRIKV